MAAILTAAGGASTTHPDILSKCHHVSDQGEVIETNSAKLSASLSELFPPGALAAELRGSGDLEALLPDERQYHRGAVQKRAQEFAAGRMCAHRLLAEFGIVDFPIKVAADRQPLWPDELVGSITHTTGFCAAVVASKKSLSAVGIDSEIAASVEAKLWRGICTPSEMAWLGSLPQAEQTSAATLIFSAKEAFYKCQYPLLGARLGFHDASVEPAWGFGRGSFTIHVDGGIALARHASLPLEGRYLFHEQFVTTGIALPGSR